MIARHQSLCGAGNKHSTICWQAVSVTAYQQRSLRISTAQGVGGRLTGRDMLGRPSGASLLTHTAALPRKFQTFQTGRRPSAELFDAEPLVSNDNAAYHLRGYHLKSKRGGRRPGAGRPAGVRNRATIQKEEAASRAVENALARLSEEEIQRLTPLEVMELGMHLLLQAGDMKGAIATAEKLAPYVAPKIASADATVPLPADLEPDAPAQPDEPGPEGGIIDPLSEPRGVMSENERLRTGGEGMSEK